MTPLSEIAVGANATIRELSDACPEPVRQRLASLGFNNEARISKLRRAPLGDPSVYQVMGYQMCLRDHEAQHIYCEVTDE